MTQRMLSPSPDGAVQLALRSLGGELLCRRDVKLYLRMSAKFNAGVWMGTTYDSELQLAQVDPQHFDLCAPALALDDKQPLALLTA